MPSIATKIERVADIAEALSRLKTIADGAQVPSVMKALSDAQASVAYALRQLRNVQAATQPLVSPEDTGT